MRIIEGQQQSQTSDSGKKSHDNSWLRQSIVQVLH